MPKSANLHVGFAVAVAVRFAPSRLPRTSNVTSFVVPWIVTFPESVSVKSPLAGTVPLIFVGTSSALGNWLVRSVSILMKRSRSRWSLVSVVRSNEIFESLVNVPSTLSVKDPVAPVATSTASDGALTPTSCSRTRTVAFEVSPTDQVPCATGPAVPGAVAVGAGAVLGVAAPPHAATNSTASRAQTKKNQIVTSSAPLQESSRICHIDRNAWRIIRALGMLAASDLKDGGINLHCIDCPATIAQRPSYVVSSTRADHQYMRLRHGKTKRQIVRIFISRT